MTTPGQHDHEHAGHDDADDTMFSAEFWDQRYGERDALWSGHPNPQLVAEAAELAPGRALDAGCGEGADAIWLAEHGWRVTAVDVSAVALGRGAAHAERLGADVAGRITWQQADLLAWSPELGHYDLVTAQFMQIPTKLRSAFFTRLADGVAEGGILLIVGHSPADMTSGVRRPQFPDLYFTAGQVADGLDTAKWSVLVSEARPRQAQDQDGNPATVHDEVLAARRHRAT